MITLTGISRFRVQQEVSGFTPYRRCDVSWDGFSGDLGAPEHDKNFDREVRSSTFLAGTSRHCRCRPTGTA
jgi:Lon protease-like protein